MGNTVINFGSNTVTLQKGYTDHNFPNIILGYPTGYNGGTGYSGAGGIGGKGGAFGYGGGGHGVITVANRTPAGGGAGCDLISMTGR